MYSSNFLQILCVILSVIYVKANIKYPLGAASGHYELAVDVPKLEAGLLNQDMGGQDQLLLQQLINKWRLANPVSKVAAETAAIIPEATSSTTVMPTTTITTATTGAESNNISNDKNNVIPNENANHFSMASYPNPFFNQPIYAAIYPLTNYNIPNHISQMTQTLPGGNGFTHSISSMAQPVASANGVPQASAVSQLPQTMLSMSGVSYSSGYNPMQFTPSVHNRNGIFKK